MSSTYGPSGIGGADAQCRRGQKSTLKEGWRKGILSMRVEILLCIALRQDLRYVRLASNSLYNLERDYILDSSASISPVLWLVIGGLCSWFAIISPTEIITKNGIGRVMPLL